MLKMRATKAIIPPLRLLAKKNTIRKSLALMTETEKVHQRNPSRSYATQPSTPTV